MSDSYSAYLEAQEEKWAQEKNEELERNKGKLKAKLKKCKKDLKSSKLDYIKCCGTCTYLRHDYSSCSRLCISDISKFNVCKYWKLDDMYCVPVKDQEVDEGIVQDLII